MFRFSIFARESKKLSTASPYFLHRKCAWIKRCGCYKNNLECLDALYVLCEAMLRVTQIFRDRAIQIHSISRDLTRLLSKASLRPGEQWPTILSTK
jgi:hypothetical protein